MSLTTERDEAFAAASAAMAVARLHNAIIRDTFPTAAEQAARMNAYAECLDKEDR